jgi:hypothetical protein
MTCGFGPGMLSPLFLACPILPQPHIYLRLDVLVRVYLTGQADLLDGYFVTLFLDQAVRSNAKSGRMHLDIICTVFCFLSIENGLSRKVHESSGKTGSDIG